MTTTDHNRGAIRLDSAWLADVGLGALPAAAANELLGAAYNRLELDVGLRIDDRLSEAEFAAFRVFVEGHDEAGALAWLNEHVPDYRDIVVERFMALSGHIRDNAARLLDALATEES